MSSSSTTAVVRAGVRRELHDHWLIDRSFLLVPAQEYVGAFLATFKEFPPSQKVGSFGIDDALEKLQTAPAGSQ
jgi:hypothetical protein